jgi:ribosomal protein S18 acetylase RimI-like enzyme
MTFRVRDATIEDVPALAALHVATFNETHTGGRNSGPPASLRENRWREIFERRDDAVFCLLIEDSKGDLVGFAKGEPHDGGIPGFAGELDKIYVLRRAQRQGLGRLLLCQVASRFLHRGVTSMLLFGEASNPSNGFYESSGAERLYAPNGEFHGGYGWRDLPALVGRCGGVAA